MLDAVHHGSEGSLVHVHPTEHRCRGQGGFILLRLCCDLCREREGLLKLDVVALSGWSVGWPWAVGLQLLMTAWVCVGWPLVRLTDCMQICRAGCLFGCFLIYWIWKDRVARRRAEWMPMCVSLDFSGPQQRFMHMRCLQYHHRLAVLQRTRLLSFGKTSAGASQLSTPEQRCICREYYLYSADKI